MGNNRIVADNVGNVAQENDYYPFGLPKRTNMDEEAQPYKFGGKEYDKMLGLDQYDFHARQYDPATIRFTSVDPLAEKFYSWSPYNYCFNNPMKFIDPTGMAPIFDEEGNLIGTDEDGWKGTAIVMNKDNYKEGMSNKDALKAGTKLNEYGKGIKISDESWTTVTDNGGSRMNAYVSNNSKSTVYFKPEDNLGEYKNDGAYALAAGTDLYMPVDGVKTENMMPNEVFKVSDGGVITIDSEGNVTSDHIRSIALSIIPEGIPLLSGSKTGYRTFPDNSWLKLKNSFTIFKDSPINKTIKTYKF